MVSIPDLGIVTSRSSVRRTGRRAAPLVARAVAVAALVSALVAPSVYGDDAATAAALLAKRAPSVVTVKFVQRMRHPQMGERESNAEARGVVVDRSGLVMLSNDALDPGSSLLRGLSRRDGAAELKSTPTDFKVLLGDDAKEHAAVLVTRDATTSLAYVQILDPGAPLPEVDLAARATPRVGATVYGVSRRSRGFDAAPYLERGFVSGQVETPRPLWSFASIGGVTIGLPFYDADGQVVGIAVQMSGVDGAEGGGLFSRPDVGLFLLPIDAVVRALEAVKKLVPDAVAKARAARVEVEPEKAPTTTPTPDRPKPPVPDVPK